MKRAGFLLLILAVALPMAEGCGKKKPDRGLVKGKVYRGEGDETPFPVPGLVLFYSTAEEEKTDHGMVSKVVGVTFIDKEGNYKCEVPLGEAKICVTTQIGAYLSGKLQMLIKHEIESRKEGKVGKKDRYEIEALIGMMQDMGMPGFEDRKAPTFGKLKDEEKGKELAKKLEGMLPPEYKGLQETVQRLRGMNPDFWKMMQAANLIYGNYKTTPLTLNVKPGEQTFDIHIKF